MTFFSDGFLLKIILLLPIVAILHILSINSRNVNFIRVVSLCYGYSIFVYSLLLYVFYRKDGIFSGLFQYAFKLRWIDFFNLNFTYGLDGISLFFFILTAFLIPLCILSSWESIKFRFKEFVLLLFVIEFLLFQAFSVLDLFLFYVFFESVLIPMFVMIGVWGSRSRKIHASYQFFIYTFFGSVFMLLGVIYIYSYVGTTDYRVLLTKEFLPSVQILLWLSFFASFAVKIPMVPVHIWLPEAHVEAPTAGSVLLAGILLKLGTYGLIRFSLPLFPFATRYFTPLILVISVVSIVYSSLTTLRQIDLKKIIAYTSVAHMNMVTIGIFSNSINGLEGALSLMLSHGLVSSGLFLSIGIVYDRYGTRLLKYYGGLINFMPLFGFVFLVFSLANMGFPGTSAFIGEILIFSGSFSINSLAAFLACTSVIFSGAYSVWLYNRVMYGPVNTHLTRFCDLNSRELFYMGWLSLLILFFGIYPNGILETMHTSCTVVLRSLENWKELNLNLQAFNVWFARDFLENHLETPFMIETQRVYEQIRHLHPDETWISFVESFRQHPQPFHVVYYAYLKSPIYLQHQAILQLQPELCSTWDVYYKTIFLNLNSNLEVLDLPVKRLIETADLLVSQRRQDLLALDPESTFLYT